MALYPDLIGQRLTWTHVCAVVVWHDPLSCHRAWLRRGVRGRDTKVLFGVLFLPQTQLAGARDSFGAPLDLELAKDLPIVSLDRVQGEEEPLANLVVGESLSNEPEDL